MKTDLNQQPQLKIASSSTEQQLKNCVKARANQGDYVVAIALLDQLIAIRPDNAAHYNNRGLMHFRNNQIIEALCDLSLALEINPQLDSAYNNRANCYAAQGDLGEAIADYDLALDLNPANLRAWINQGIAFRELELYDLGLENFDIALLIGNALQDRIYGERGRTYHLRGDWNCAVSDYQTALDILTARTPNYAVQASPRIHSGDSALTKSEEAPSSYGGVSLTDKPDGESYFFKVQSWLDELLSPLMHKD